MRGAGRRGSKGLAGRRLASGERRSGDPRLDAAVHALADWRPDLSAALHAGPVQVVLVAGIVLAIVVAVAHGGRAGLPLTLLLAAPFLVSAVVRMGALRLVAGRTPPVEAPPLSDSLLPRYSVLVPLYREEGVAPQIVDALAALDYPADRLEVLLVVEASDPGTHATILATRTLTPAMRFVVVPDGRPRTKPRALNYALAEATGDLVVVYDAEDIPEPDQLRRAAAAFARDPEVGCLQARLNIYNAGESWLTRQFTMEYTALFDALLPMLARLGWPVPLGGTSNHFRRAVLDACRAWDPFNVTEDADLGVRLGRLGWRVGVLASTTWEEAPPTWRVWIGQRTRWLKGWMQTWLVHTRRPVRLWRELGPWGALGFHLWSATVLVSALVHPWLYVALAWQLIATALAPTTVTAAVQATLAAAATPADDGMTLLGWLALLNMGLGYASAMALGRVAVARRNLHLEATAWTLPFYWLAISWAAHRALIELIRAPFHWEKTAHRGDAPRARPPRS